MEFSVSEVLSPIVDALVVYALDVAGALAILVLGYLLAGWATRLIREQAAKTSLLDPTIGIALGKVARVGILTLTLIAVLNRVGVPTASLLAVLGTAGLTISLALQGMLRNVAAGAMLLTLRPFGVGDSVKVGGCEAVVDEIGLFLTRLHTFDNIAVAIPNHEIWGSEIRNYSQNRTRRLDLVFDIGYEDDIAAALRLAREVLASDSRVLSEPEALVAVGELADSSVRLYVRPWVNVSDVLATRLGLTRRVKERFDEAGISIPFPQRDVHLYKQHAVA